METKIKNLTVIKTPNPKPIPKANELGFGKIFTDHIFTMDYDPEHGWHNPTIQPYDALPIEPGNITFHYGQTVFDGLKCYYGIDGKIRFFRVKDYIKRFNNSARAMVIPQFNEEELIEYLTELILIEKDWVPKETGTSLYIRPLIISMDNALGVRSSNTYKMFIILSPVGSYYAVGFNPVKILVE
jgi:branched-chain amino acid aminotransferase